MQKFNKSSHIVLAQWPTVSPTSYTFKQFVNATLKNLKSKQAQDLLPPNSSKIYQSDKHIVS